ncbi:Uncharacterised protein [Salmonella enterica subsp. enterica serovar Typhi]|nr:Uncharacterised protein [Salmonella enterica subsp. enterica serovar Typhi]
MVLRVVTNTRVFRPFNGAVIGVQIANQRLQQRRFTHAIGAEYRQLLADFEQQIDIFKQRTVIKTFRQRLHFQSVTEQFFILLKTDERVLTAGGFHLFQLDFINLPRARRCLTRFRGIGAKTANKRLQLGNLRFFLRIIGQQTFTRLGRRRHILIIVTRIDAQVTVIQIRHMRTNHVQEVTVVRNDDHRAIALVQHLLQPTDSINIQVVGRFVEQQDVRIRE